MNVCTVSQFRDSLTYPHILLRTLRYIIFDPDRVSCTKHFAECSASLDSKRLMLYAPITTHGFEMASEATRILREIDEEYIDMHIIPNEICFSGLAMGECCMIVESFPAGLPLSEAIYTLSHDHLISGLNSLMSRFERYDISHNYLNLESIIVDSNYTWHTIRNCYINRGYGNDEESFNEFRKLIDERAIRDNSNDNSHNDALLLHSTITDDNGNTLFPCKERRRRFITDRGVGFKDESGIVVISDIYTWASDFEEDRAMVCLNNGCMGVINRYGRYIIEPRYSKVEYSSYDGTSLVYDGELCARFDYLGEQLEEWHHH